jgi:hypothetical protein
VRTDQRRIDIDLDLLRARPQLPRPLASLRARRAQSVEQLGLCRDTVDQPKRGRVRGDRAEQRLLIAHHAQIRQTVPAVSEHHRQITDHPPWIVAATALTHTRERHRQRPRQPDTIRGLREQRGARMRHQPLSVRRDIYCEIAAIALHPQGDPPELGTEGFDNPNPPSSTGHFRAPGHRGRGR